MAKKNKKQLEDELNRYGREYEIAKRKGDQQGMAVAHAKANQTRKEAGNWHYDSKTGKTFEKVSPIQKQGRVVNSQKNLTLAKTGANPLKAASQQPTPKRTVTSSVGKELGKSYVEKKTSATRSRKCISKSKTGQATRAKTRKHAKD